MFNAMTSAFCTFNAVFWTLFVFDVCADSFDAAFLSIAGVQPLPSIFLKILFSRLQHNIVSIAH